MLSSTEDLAAELRGTGVPVPRLPPGPRRLVLSLAAGAARPA